MVTETERDQWNAAVESGDRNLIAVLQERHLTAIHRRIMDDDPKYAKAGWSR
jgi:hypothetical protein